MSDTWRTYRANAGLTQHEVAKRLGIARSTLANIEAGRERPSPALRERFASAFPGWALSDSVGDSLTYDETNPGLRITDLSIAYFFTFSLAPNEIIQTRRVRARRAGVYSYVLGFRRHGSAQTASDIEVLWGGALGGELMKNGQMLQVVRFSEPLQRGQVHEFATRMWVTKDEEPGTQIDLRVTQPIARAVLSLNSVGGPHRISHAWKFGPLKEGVRPIAADSEEADAVAVSDYSLAGATFADLTPGPFWGLAWEWQS